MHEQKSYGGIITIVGVIAVVALILAWAAFNRSGQDVVPVVAEGTNEAAQESAEAVNDAVNAIENQADEIERTSELIAARAKARTELLAIQAQIEAGATYAEVAGSLEETRADLRLAYQNAGVEFRTEWQDVNQFFDNTEAALRDQTGDGLDQMADLLRSLEADVRVETSAE